MRITNAAATPANASTAFATERELDFVISAYEFLRGPPGSFELPRNGSLEDGAL